MNHQFKNMTPAEIKDIEQLADYLANVSKVVFDREDPSTRPMNLLKRLIKEDLGEASSVFRFVPCVISYEKFSEYNTAEETYEFGYRDRNTGAYHTSMRELLNVGIGVEHAVKFIDFSGFVAIQAVAPYFVYGMNRTHSLIPQLSQSNRYVTTDYGYYKPVEIKATQSEWNFLVSNLSPIALEAYMRDNGVERKEMYQRGKDALELRPFSIGVDTRNKKAYEHYIELRTDAHAQEEVRDFANALRDFVDMDADIGDK